MSSGPALATSSDANSIEQQSPADVPGIVHRLKRSRQCGRFAFVMIAAYPN